MKAFGRVEVYLNLFFSLVLDELEWSDSGYGGFTRVFLPQR